jgi:hypothetical protein
MQAWGGGGGSKAPDIGNIGIRGRGAPARQQGGALDRHWTDPKRV